MKLDTLAGSVKLSSGEAYTRQQRNMSYLMELKEENLLFPYYREAGLLWSVNRKTPELHGGWDAPDSHIRGAFTAHWLSAASWIVNETADIRLKAKMDYLVSEIRRCQLAAGGEWAFPIPRSFLHDLVEGREHWAPLYVCHKVLMGLFDVFRLTGNTQAMEIIEGCTVWFIRFTEGISRDKMTEIMDKQETGGLMEIWADLYGHTNDIRYLELMKKYERETLFTGLLEGRDVLTNMHANSTIPEAHGAARAYEVTGDERYRKIAENYWDQAVTKRGMFCTGGQTCGEVWTPPGIQSARLGELNQEHCVVYNMIRLADYLFRWTGDAIYSDYIERNIYNGIFAQGFCDEGIVAYYLPLHAGAMKKWGSKTEDFWCCHCTAVQANSRLREFVYYKEDEDIIVSQFIPSVLETKSFGQNISISLSESDIGGNCNRINDISLGITTKPDYFSFDIAVRSEVPVEFVLKLKIPDWISAPPVCLLNGEQFTGEVSEGFLTVRRIWSNDIFVLRLPKKLTSWPLSDEPDTVAFLDGPIVLAGLIDHEVMLFGNKAEPAGFIKPHNERAWASWLNEYKTSGQPAGFYLKPLYQINQEKYTVYFPVVNAKPYYDHAERQNDV